MEDRNALYYVGILQVLDGSRPDIKTDPHAEANEVKDRLFEIIDSDEQLQVALVGNPAKWSKSLWEAGLRYFIVADTSNDVECVEAGYVIPSDYHKKGIYFRKFPREDIYFRPSPGN